MWFRKRFDFYQMLLAQARMSEEGLRLLCEYMQNPTSDLGRRVKDTEEAADELRRILIEALNLTFITPFDREDVFSLSRAVDDMVDYAKSTVEEMMLFEVHTNTHLQKMANTLYEASQHISAAMSDLRLMSSDLQSHIIRAKKLENQMEHFYREALAELFKTSDVVVILKLREIYRHLSNAADRGDEAADILSDILVKNA